MTTHAALADAMADLTARCSYMAEMHRTAGHPALRRQQRGFPGLVRIILGQQVSAASATATFKRVCDSLGPPTPDVVLATSDEALRAVGVSGPKQKSLRALSSALATGALDLKSERTMSDAALHDALTAVTGIGPWSADIYLIFCLGRADAFAAGDLALQIAVQDITAAGTRPSPEDLSVFADRWRPYRGAAARMLWTYYEHRKRKPSDRA